MNKGFLGYVDYALRGIVLYYFFLSFFSSTCPGPWLIRDNSFYRKSLVWQALQ